ncbi:MAG: hypothetical protein RBT63_08235 [Bdellovibrionales bacterium]|jgi:hypothetical protein|nr:hypothetical protein [Bdellovibrionales bacterium]
MKSESCVTAVCLGDDCGDCIDVQRIGVDDCQMELGDARVVLSYDAAYELAIRLSRFIQSVQNLTETETEPVLN